MDNAKANLLYKFLAALIIAGTVFGIFSISNITFASSPISITKSTPDPNSKNNTWFIFNQSSGSTIEDEVVIKNLGNETINVQVFATDSENNKAGRFIPKLNSQPQENIGKWTTITKPTVEIPAKTSTKVAFKIDIPNNITPGEYTGGIIAKELKRNSCDNQKDCQTNSTITTQVGNRVYLTVSGKDNKNNLTWNSISHKSPLFKDHQILNKQSYFQFKFTNDGTQVERPKIKINIRSNDQIINTITHDLGEIHPKSTSEPIIKWHNPPLFGHFTAEATVMINNNEKITKQIKFWLIPTELIFIVLGLIGIGALLFFSRNSIFPNLIAKK